MAKSSKSKTDQRQSGLADVQEEGLREGLRYRGPFLSGILRDYQMSSVAPNPAMVAGSVGRVNEQFDLARNRTLNQLAQRGVSGGFTGNAIANLEARRTSALSDVREQSYLTNLNQKNILMGAGLGLFRGTAAAPILSRQRSTGGDAEVIAAYGQAASGAAAISASGGCWVAEELYGVNDMRTHYARYYVSITDNWFTKAYRRWGRSWARTLRYLPFLKPLVKPIWDDLYSRGVISYNGHRT